MKTPLDVLIRMRNIVFALTFVVPASWYGLARLLPDEPALFTRGDAVAVAVMSFAALLMLTVSLTGALHDVRENERARS